MKIINLQGENFKRMKAFNITPKGNTIIISGKNGQGKSSCIDSIVLALAGGRNDLAKLTTKPIREGEKSASVTVTTEEAVITRTWNKHGSTLEMTNREGLVYKSPQELLNQILGGTDLLFDPLAFSRMKPKDQRDELLSIVKIDIDLKKWEEDRRFEYDQRTSANTGVKELEGKLATLPIIDPDTPDEEISISKLSEELQDYESHNRDFDDGMRRGAELDSLIEDLEMRLKAAKSQRNDITAWLEENKKIDVMELKKKIHDADEINKNVRIKKDRIDAEKKKSQYESISEDHTKRLKQMEETKAEALKKARFPIAGLSFTEEGVTFMQPNKEDGTLGDEIPFAQLSSALQLKISMAIAMAKNPKLRVIRITDGSLLDEDNMKVIEEMAEEKDFQIWIECVRSDGKIGIVIEDGEIIKDNYASTPSHEA